MAGDLPPEIAALPGRREAATIAAWAEARRASGEFGDRVMPPTVGEGAVIELREVTAENVRELCSLQVAPSQRSFVAPNAVSIAQASFAPGAWPRGVYADGVAVGFAMLHVEPERPDYHLWRFMIDEAYQGRGYGRAAIERIIEHVRTQPGGVELTLSYVPADGGPEPFYRSLGFVPTGKLDEGEVEARLRLAETAPEG